MTSLRTYLDWNATAPLAPEARAAVMSALEATGNASSVHAEGRRARATIEEARERVAALIGAAPRDIFFTSGGTESNNTVLAAGWEVIVHAGIEHASVLAPAEASGAKRVAVPIGRDGIVAPEAVAAAIAQGGGRAERTLVTLQFANNETGVMQPIAEVAAIVRAHGCRMHTDAVQAAGRIALDLTALAVDFATLSGHKLGGPQGTGVLYVRSEAEIPAMLIGGGQERGRRAGTESVAMLAGLGAAAEAARRRLATPAVRLVAGSDTTDHPATVGALRDRLEQGVSALTPEAIIVGATSPRLANTCCLALPGRAAETMVIALDLAGIAVSAGAACSSGKVAASHVLAAMGLPEAIVGSAIRVSLGPTTTVDDIERFLAAWARLTGAGSANTNNEKRRA
jgi:cysteine desulfurase